MTNELLINVTFGETRVARLENGAVAEFYAERASDASIVGNIYKGRVVRVLPGMQAAFVDIGLSRTAFLHVSDIIPENVIDIGGEPIEIARPQQRNAAIEDILKEGREVVVQVAKEPVGGKGARITSFISIAGRYLVYMPTVNHIGVSRRIGDPRERDRLRSFVEKMRPAGSGFIIRTASEGVSPKELKADITYLTNLWGDIEAKKAKTKAPALIHAELDMVLRAIRDLLTDDIDKVVIDSRESYERICNFVKTFMQKSSVPIEYYDGRESLFDLNGVEHEISRALSQKVWLKSGGYIIIEQTEALTAIDVNTGKFVGKHNVEDTILKTNLEAVKEIVYQLRLRNIGGIIILDFIDMDKPANQHKVYKALKEALKADRTRTTISKISELGLVEMTRKRTRDDLRTTLTDPCPYCEGKGYLKNPITVSYEIFRELKKESQSFKGKQIMVLAHPSVIDILCEEERKMVEELEKSIRKRVITKGIKEYHLEQFELVEK